MLMLMMMIMTIMAHWVISRGYSMTHKYAQWNFQWSISFCVNIFDESNNLNDVNDIRSVWNRDTFINLYVTQKPKHRIILLQFEIPHLSLSIGTILKTVQAKPKRIWFSICMSKRCTFTEPLSPRNELWPITINHRSNWLWKYSSYRS